MKRPAGLLPKVQSPDSQHLVFSGSPAVRCLSDVTLKLFPGDATRPSLSFNFDGHAYAVYTNEADLRLPQYATGVVATEGSTERNVVGEEAVRAKLVAAKLANMLSNFPSHRVSDLTASFGSAINSFLAYSPELHSKTHKDDPYTELHGLAETVFGKLSAKYHSYNPSSPFIVYLQPASADEAPEVLLGQVRSRIRGALNGNHVDLSIQSIGKQRLVAITANSSNGRHGLDNFHGAAMTVFKQKPRLYKPRLR